MGAGAATTYESTSLKDLIHYKHFKSSNASSIFQAPQFIVIEFSVRIISITLSSKIVNPAVLQNFGSVLDEYLIDFSAIFSTCSHFRKTRLNSTLKKTETPWERQEM
jgi:hypothetical protein